MPLKHGNGMDRFSEVPQPESRVFRRSDDETLNRMGGRVSQLGIVAAQGLNEFSRFQVVQVRGSVPRRGYYLIAARQPICRYHDPRVARQLFYRSSQTRAAFENFYVVVEFVFFTVVTVFLGRMSLLSKIKTEIKSRTQKANSYFLPVDPKL